ncbi:P-loop containing nucleoside triphosphate hydrolase protein [Mycena polygramma]|nr:P-loop containing nucleoside triphosphate hydrolase protein [Mycena polygramma]
MAHCDGILKRVFKLGGFREDQREIIAQTVAGRDIVVLMPTAGGKSLCFQLPAVYENERTNGVTIVISPLLALIQDQVRALRDKEIDVVGVEEEMDHKLERLGSDSNPSLLYCTPEKLQKSRSLYDALRGLYKAGDLKRFAVDEAHCISTWGDFRSAYGALSVLRDDFPGVPIMALTATATSKTVADIVQGLKLINPTIFRQSFDRPNLKYVVKPKRNEAREIVDFITEHSEECGIVYCTTKASTARLADQLVKSKVTTCHYHAGLTKEEREDIHRRWKRGEFRVIVATIAFGMGIDKPDVRFVIHYDPPRSLDSYCQESGRAGRDGLPAQCIIYYRFQDVKTILASADEGSPEASLQSRENADTVVLYCEQHSVCRRVQLLRHFGEKHKGNCGMCDNCPNTDRTPHDLSAQAKMAVNLVQAFDPVKENLTVNHFIALFRGADTVETRKNGRNLKSGYGAGSKVSNDEAELLFDKLLSMNILMEKRIGGNGRNLNYYLKVGLPIL